MRIDIFHIIAYFCGSTYIIPVADLASNGSMQYSSDKLPEVAGGATTLELLQAGDDEAVQHPDTMLIEGNAHSL